MNEEIDLLRDAAKEIDVLRKANQIMSARLGVFDSMMALFNITPHYEGVTNKLDICYLIEKRIAFLKDQENSQQ
jgi:hypothetical protein